MASLYLKEKNKTVRREVRRVGTTTTQDLMRKRKLTRGRETEVFLFSTGGIVEFENVKNSLRILFLFIFTDVGGLKETGPLLRHALDKQTCMHLNKPTHSHGNRHCSG